MSRKQKIMGDKSTGTGPGFDLAPPSAVALVESLRGVGYSLSTAIADLIDNSISALASTIRIDFHWGGNDSWIRIIDDGKGMDTRELREAMCLGHRSPQAIRDSNDLGRFGLGMKTASFSQCRKLTVASRKRGGLTVRRWDLDHIVNHAKDWHLLIGPAPGSELHLASLDDIETGTMVLWEQLDRVTGNSQSSNKHAQDAFLEGIDRVEDHLAMVFHRFLEGAHPSLRIYINGMDENHIVKPWDPFMAHHPATTHCPQESIAMKSGVIKVKGFILPHKDKLEKGEYERGEGPDGWTSQQGFYVYRNGRMLVSGSWLGLGSSRLWTKEEAHKLARIRLDIPNTADEDWKIDIKKSTARPPSAIKNRLKGIAEDIRQSARQIFAHRGNYGPHQAMPDIKRVWKTIEKKQSVAYRIDRTHPAVKCLLDQGGKLPLGIENVLRIIEETVPVQKIWLDSVENGEVQKGSFSGATEAEVSKVLEIFYRNLLHRMGLSSSAAKAQLLRTDPFHFFPRLIEMLPDDITG